MYIRYKIIIYIPHILDHFEIVDLARNSVSTRGRTESFFPLDLFPLIRKHLVIKQSRFYTETFFLILITSPFFLNVFYHLVRGFPISNFYLVHILHCVRFNHSRYLNFLYRKSFIPTSNYFFRSDFPTICNFNRIFFSAFLISIERNSLYHVLLQKLPASMLTLSTFLVSNYQYFWLFTNSCYMSHP